MKNRYKLVIVIIIILCGCSNGTDGTDGSENYNVAIKRDTSYIEDGKYSVFNNTDDDRDENIKNILESQGIDGSIVEDKKRTESGATILGDALPVKECRTLAEGEEIIGYYLGLHNKLESLPDYELVQLFIINNEFMYAIYENQNDLDTILIKTSKIKDSKDLTSVYEDYKLKDIINIEGVDVNVSSNTEGIVNLAYFDVKNGKSYSIFNKAGLEEGDIKLLLKELISNLKIMDDWVD